MDKEKTYLFDKPENVKRLMHILYACCAILFLLDFVIHRHVVHQWEGMWGFYAVYGFVGCTVLVLVATWMRTFLMRSEDYYDDEGKTEHDKAVATKAGGQDVDA